MTTTTDLLRRAAEDVYSYAMTIPLGPSHEEKRVRAGSLLALADEMERSEPVAVRQWHDKFKCWNYDDIEDVLPSCKGERLYTHPAPEVRRALQMVADDLDTCTAEWGADYEFNELSPETIEGVKRAMQEPKP